jgi:hypothetical protein
VNSSIDANIQSPSSALKMETVCISETLASTDESTWRQKPEEHYHEKSKFFFPFNSKNWWTIVVMQIKFDMKVQRSVFLNEQQCEHGISFNWYAQEDFIACNRRERFKSFLKIPYLRVYEPQFFLTRIYPPELGCSFSRIVSFLRLSPRRQYCMLWNSQ